MSGKIRYHKPLPIGQRAALRLHQQQQVIDRIAIDGFMDNHLEDIEEEVSQVPLLLIHYMNMNTFEEF